MKPFNVEIPIIPLTPPKEGDGSGWQPLNPRTEILPKGWKGARSEGIKDDILIEHDVAIPVRDGIKLYADIYRPAYAPARDTPALLCWSPFGKKFNGISSLKLMTPWNLGIPSGTLSGLEKFEAPDPAEWCPRGYAVVNIDCRGAFDSEGVMAVLGTQEGEDGYDTIEFLAKQDWCNGKVGLAGNSHLAIAQWFIAAQNPPSLACIAPWEGCGDLYREQFCRGGIYGGELFDEMITKWMLKGRNGVEGFRKMYDQSPIANDWWNDKRPDMTKINVPTYITGTWTNTMHGMGAIRGWLEIPSEKKWLRWHPWQEWFDLWGNPQANDELIQYFDHFLKGIDNGWEKTPRVRMGVLKFGEKVPLENVVEEDFPLPRTQYKKAFLAPDNKLSLDSTPSTAQTISYDSENGEHISFTHTFPNKTQIVGMTKAILYMSCADLDDMDVYLLLRKISTAGEEMLNLNIPWKGLPVSKISDIPADIRTEVILYAGPTGIQRASMRAIDWSKSMHENWPYYPMDRVEKVPRGDIVRLEIGIWATGIEFDAGESLRLQVCGRHQGMNNFGTTEFNLNKGRHVVHFGGEFDSHVVLPFT